jgi:drug/metabolite transporter (DMT)-like permease
VTPRRADLLLIATTAIWGASFVVVKGALAGSTPLAFVAVRFGLAALIMTPFVDLKRPLPRSELSSALLLTGLLAAGFATQAVGLVHTTPARSAFVVALSSVIAPAVAFVALRQRQRPTVLMALTIAAAGLYFLTAPETGGLNRGDMWTLVTAFVFGAQIVAVAEFAGRFDRRRLVWLQLIGTTLTVAACAVLLERPELTWSWELAAALAYTAVFATALAFVWQMRAQREMSSARAALIFCFEPVFAALASWIWIGERLTPTQWLGGGLIVAGMILSDLPLKRRGTVAP